MRDATEQQIEAAAERAYLNNRAGDTPWADLSARHKQDWRTKVTSVINAAFSAAWHPIETAPKDGTYILLTNDIFVDVGRFSHGSFGGFASDSDPTHWMPLPTPPRPHLDDLCKTEAK